MRRLQFITIKACSVVYNVMLLTCLLSLHSAYVHAAGTVGTSRSERGALKVLYWATQGPTWKRQWDVQNVLSDPCLNNWYGIVCDHAGHIKSIHLANNNLVGSIPPEFPRPGLRFLKELDLSSNFLTGPLPDTLSLLQGLLVLRLDRNNFLGQVPATLSQLRFLEFLEIQGNQFDAVQGEILPEEVKALGRNGRCHLIDR
uniref:Leucine-rich repeat and WD repeat-containing protein 1 LRR domain-containing protein n=1 Tax=Globisporangium ultimum (strain ATCC 200006 / CBS 805.95 / DAOM BR144) TaxID=431595 RepID=K3WX52_GLOUD